MILRKVRNFRTVFFEFNINRGPTRGTFVLSTASSRILSSTQKVDDLEILFQKLSAKFLSLFSKPLEDYVKLSKL